MEIIRSEEISEINKNFSLYPIVGILGPRQCGKTTLSRQYQSQSQITPVHQFDLENPNHYESLSDGFHILENLEGLIVLDEIQRLPQLFEWLRVLSDDPKKKRKFLILGSSSPELIKGNAESLSGRIGFIFLTGFNLKDVGYKKSENLLLRGGMPRSYLAKNDDLSSLWREDYLLNLVQRDIPLLNYKIPSEKLRRFLKMLAHYHAKIFDAASISKSLDISKPTVRDYLDIFVGTYIVRELQPWHANTKKRLVKRPKIYFRDSGFALSLMGIKTKTDLLNHPKLGDIWEGFAVEEVIEELNLKSHNVFFWATHNNAEIDLVFEHNGEMYGIECKYTSKPSKTKSMDIASKDLNLKHIFIITPQCKMLQIDEKTTTLPISKSNELTMLLS